jgi:uncharacterized membrane protein YfcA
MLAVTLLISKVLIGMLVGILIGLSGVGGGVLLLPILIFGLGVPPITAVGSDAVFNALTKIGAGFLHWRQRTVNWRLVRTLVCGSIPGAFCGVELLGYLRTIYGNGVNDILRVIVGVLLVAVPTMMLFQGSLERYFSFVKTLSDRDSFVRISLIGLFAGLLVGMSSVGSGSIIMVLLLIFMRCSPAALVGTDIVHAVFLTGAASIFHLRLGTVDASIVFPLLIGSVPGSLLGVQLSNRMPSQWLRRALCVVLFAAGTRMLL